jgi:hypothetical protein
MRASLGHWFRISEEEEQKLWAEGLFSFDASTLLNIYGYSKETRSELVSLIEAQAARVRLPHQFGLEFSRNRPVVIIKQVNNYAKADKALQEFQKTHVAPKREHPHLSSEALTALERVKGELGAGKREMETMISADEFADKVLATFEGRLGPCPDAKELAELHDQARDRYDKKVPPGYADLKDKGAPEGYGDYIGWTQLIEISKKEARGFILVTDDLKDDWWFIEHERTIGPRAELIQEFRQLSGQPFWMYSSENFLRAAKKFFNAGIKDAAIEEVTVRLQAARKATLAEVIRNIERRLQLNLSESLDKGDGGVPEGGAASMGDSEKPDATSDLKDGDT